MEYYLWLMWDMELGFVCALVAITLVTIIPVFFFHLVWRTNAEVFVHHALRFGPVPSGAFRLLCFPLMGLLLAWGELNYVRLAWHCRRWNVDHEFRQWVTSH